MGEDDRYFVHGTSTAPDQAHVPLILRAPGLAAERRSEIVHHVDIMPTLLELAGLGRPLQTSGIALGPWLRGEEPMPDRIVYCDDGWNLSAYGPGRFVRVFDIGGAWPTDDSSAKAPMAPSWAEFTWLPEGRWVASSPSEYQLREQIRSYFRDAVPMIEAEADSAALKSMLRALGYGE